MLWFCNNEPTQQQFSKSECWKQNKENATLLKGYLKKKEIQKLKKGLRVLKNMTKLCHKPVTQTMRGFVGEPKKGTVGKSRGGIKATFYEA